MENFKNSKIKVSKFENLEFQIYKTLTIKR